MDRIRTAVLGHALNAITEEMGANLYQSARSTIIREVRDMTTGLLDHRGRFIAGSAYVPMLMGAIEPAARALAEEFDFNSLGPNDALVLNDPFKGGQHLNDVFVFLPIHLGDRLIGLACAAAHHPDLGGVGTAGYAGTDVFQEGVNIPGVRVSLGTDWRNESFGRMLLGNVRAPEIVQVDFEAQLAACRTGARRVVELAKRYGSGELLEFYDHVIDYSRTLVEASIALLPDGCYQAEGEVENDGAGGGPFRIKVKLTVDGPRMSVDFEGTDEQAIGYINAPWGSTVSSVRVTLLSILECAHGFVNSGAFDAIEIKAPLGTIVNPRRPAPTRARTQVALRSMEALCDAVADLLPHRIPAQGYNCQTSLTFAKQDERYSILSEIMGAGWGATSERDGANAMGALLVNALNTPIEAIETEFPFLRLSSYRILEGSGGQGAQRGGEGMERAYDILQDGVDFVHISERYELGGSGRKGGKAGATGSCTLIRAGETHALESKGVHRLNTGDRIVMRTGGGGGYGVVGNA